MWLYMQYVLEYEPFECLPMLPTEIQREVSDPTALARFLLSPNPSNMESLERLTSLHRSLADRQLELSCSLTKNPNITKIGASPKGITSTNSSSKRDIKRTRKTKCKSKIRRTFRHTYELLEVIEPALAKRILAQSRRWARLDGSPLHEFIGTQLAQVCSLNPGSISAEPRMEILDKDTLAKEANVAEHAKNNFNSSPLIVYQTAEFGSNVPQFAYMLENRPHADSLFMNESQSSGSSPHDMCVQTNEAFSWSKYITRDSSSQGINKDTQTQEIPDYFLPIE